MNSIVIRLKPEMLVGILQGKEVVIKTENNELKIVMEGESVVFSHEEYERNRRQIYKEGYNDGLVDKLKQLSPAEGEDKLKGKAE